MTHDGLHASRNDFVLAGKGGLAIGLAPELNALVTLMSSTPCGQALLVHLDRLSRGPVGLLNVYGPNTALERIDLWHSILSIIDLSRPWIVGVLELR